MNSSGNPVGTALVAVRELRTSMLLRGTIAALASLVITTSANAAVLRVAEMTVDEIQRLDRAKTVVILPGGILEQHASHLPSYSDGYMNADVAEGLAKAISARKGWNALVFPMIPLGAGGANEIGGKHVYPGTYAVRAETLRDIFMDLAVELGEQGFRWVFIVHNHGSPWHNQALDAAGDFFHDTYGGRMVNLQGLEPDWSIVAKARTGLVSKQALAEDMESVHAGLSETSRLMYLRPDLVKPVKGLKNVSVPPDAMTGIATRPDWPGYFGAPKYANAKLGKSEHETAKKLWIDIALKILDGTDPATFTRYADMMLAIPPIAAIGEGTSRYDAGVRAKQEKWLESRKKSVTNP